MGSCEYTSCQRHRTARFAQHDILSGIHRDLEQRAGHCFIDHETRRPDECRDSFELGRPLLSDELWGKVDLAESPRFADNRHGQADEGMKASNLAGRRHGQAVLADIPRDPEVAGYPRRDLGAETRPPRLAVQRIAGLGERMVVPLPVNRRSVIQVSLVNDKSGNHIPHWHCNRCGGRLVLTNLPDAAQAFRIRPFLGQIVGR